MRDCASGLPITLNKTLGTSQPLTTLEASNGMPSPHPPPGKDSLHSLQYLLKQFPDLSVKRIRAVSVALEKAFGL